MENNTIKNIFKVTAMACFIALASNAVAGPSANVQVKGSVKTGACTPTLDNGGVVDYGDISTDLLSTSANQMPQKKLNLNISCTNETVISVSVKDNRNSSLRFIEIKNAYANNSTSNTTMQQFGLGKTKTGTNIGAYVISLDQTTLINEGTQLDAIVKDDAESEWVKASGARAAGSTMSNNSRKWSFASTGTLTPTAIKSIAIPLKISMALPMESALNITELTNLDGNATFNINYL
ncbi:DUF1120 domain-containing protein [Ewingella americana]|uniref:DUF1120 domain-containing protein n=1 Tax=Ewingella americana TaxID=41202 RepID=UPI0012AE109D|nr:DUF1120 domain-containing protein [Ewingella americana]MRT03211.1 DUF1120 domain-containing protein [Ewingella americana]